LTQYTPFFTDAMISAGIAVAGRHVGVGHARHRHMGVALAPAVAGRLHVHQPRVLAVLHVADEMPSSISTVRLVGVPSSSIESEPRRLWKRAVVDHGDALGRHLLAHQAGEGRGLLAVEVAFEARGRPLRAA
jgi:hypothetical protein